MASVRAIARADALPVYAEKSDAFTAAASEPELSQTARLVLPRTGATNLEGNNMRKTMMIGAALVLMAGSAVAQTQNPPANKGPNNPAVNTTGTNNPGAPVAGANSFTEGQAKSRIESSGYGNVTGLKKDDSGVWRGKAQKDGKSVDVSLDFQGNVVAR
jgi:hypothetical protein